MAHSAYKIAAGYDNVANLVSFTTITDSDSNPLPAPALGTRFERGVLQVRPDGVSVYNGFPVALLSWAGITIGHYDALLAYEGAVTVTIDSNQDALVNYNAIFRLSEPAASEMRLSADYFTSAGHASKMLVDVTATLTRLVVIP